MREHHDECQYQPLSRNLATFIFIVLRLHTSFNGLQDLLGFVCENCWSKSHTQEYKAKKLDENVEERRGPEDALPGGVCRDINTADRLYARLNEGYHAINGLAFATLVCRYKAVLSPLEPS